MLWTVHRQVWDVLRGESAGRLFFPQCMPLFQALHVLQGFFYNRYRPPSSNDKLGTETDTNLDQQLWYQVVGTSQKEDKFVYAEPEHPAWFIGAEITDDGR